MQIRQAGGLAGGLLALMIAAAMISMPASTGAARLNVLFLIADDLNTDLAVYGAPVRSPHIDRLAARGVRFDRAYSQYPLCSPSRSSLLTGRRPNATGVLTNPSKNPMSPHFRERLPDAVTLPQLFRTNGWFVARVGKLYHYGVPNDIGTSSLDDYRSWDLAINPRGRDREIHDRIFSLTPGQFGGTVSWLADDGRDEEHTDGIAANEAVRLLERFKRNGQPFFLGVGFYRPHTPYVAPKAYFDRYPRQEIALPALSDADRSRTPAAAFGSARKDQDAMTDDQRREAIQAYRASITFMDTQVGHVLDALERLGLADTTIVVFTSDHGYHLADHGLWQKMSLFERSARVPLIIAAPGAKAQGRTARGLVELVDLYPTLASLAGLNAPATLEGVSLAPMLNDAAATVKDAAFTQVRDGYAVRTDRWRYIEWTAGEQGAQLYDMERDPAETTNVADDPRHAATRSELRARVAAYRSAKNPNVSDIVDASKRMPDGKQWTTGNLSVRIDPSYCHGDEEANCRRYGRLYTWESARRGCQSLGDGWRLPTDDEWRQLAKPYGGVYEDTSHDGKAAFTALLIGGSSGFNAPLGGNRDEDNGQYGRLEAHGFYWTASETNPANAVFYNFGKGSQTLYRQGEGNKQMAISARCVKD